MFVPPKNDLQLGEIARVIKLGFGYNFWDDSLILDFISSHQLSNQQNSLSELIIQKSKSILDKTNATLIISQLQTYYFHNAKNSDTAFVLWLVWYLVFKQRFPEMMAFA